MAGLRLEAVKRLMEEKRQIECMLAFLEADRGHVEYLVIGAGANKLKYMVRDKAYEGVLSVLKSRAAAIDGEIEAV